MGALLLDTVNRNTMDKHHYWKCSATLGRLPLHLRLLGPIIRLTFCLLTSGMDLPFFLVMMPSGTTDIVIYAPLQADTKHLQNT